VDLRFKKSMDGKTLDVSFLGHWREKPKTIIVHAPPIPGLSKIVINGKRFPAKKPIDLKNG
jgi:hypothetical protein